VAEEKMAGGQEITLVNENVDIRVTGETRRDHPVAPLMEDDRTLRVWAPNVVRRRVTRPDGRRIVREVIETEKLPIHVATAAMTGGDTLMWTPTYTDAKDIYDVEVTFIAQSATLCLITWGIDVGAGGSLNASEYQLFNFNVPGNAFAGPFTARMTGADTIRASSAGGGAANMAIRVWKVR
jgi:hypothetical protein